MGLRYTIDRLGETNQYGAVVWILRRFMYLYTIVNTTLLLPIAGKLWGAGEMILRHQYHGLSKVVNLLSVPGFESYYPVVLILLYTGCILGFFGIMPRLSAAVVFFALSTLVHREMAVSNGGYQLQVLAFFYLMFASEQDESDSGKWWLNVVSNLAIWAVRLQVCILYANAGWLKLTGVNWVNGDGLYYVLRVMEYSHPQVLAIAGDWRLFLKAGTWFTVSYQCLFPLLVWVKPVRPYLLIAGCVLHLSIAFFIGILDFGLIMVAVYPAFLSEDIAMRWKSRLLSLSGRESKGSK